MTQEQNKQKTLEERVKELEEKDAKRDALFEKLERKCELFATEIKILKQGGNL